MHFITAATASTLILAGLATAQNAFSVATPSSLQECTPYLIKWTGGQAPFIIQITAPGDTATILETLATGVTAQQYSWAVNEPAGQRVTINIVDSTGANAPSGQSPAVATGTTSCLAAGSSSASAASSSTAAGATGASSSTSSAAAATTTSSAASSGSTSSAAAAGGSSSTSAAGATQTSSSSSTDGAVSVRGYAAVAAGVVGVAAAALF